ncbi:flagellar biosynthesis anti-sigma factor FlgM [Sphingomonas abietis]|uniref:Negative regulator of flagellin synthesis n=1 Tax=Sphingomonas abietis TaxID=3012344 RepID=A0ABY7NL99_9SPHN|nr:flagellar biosynthesis anti-sigma factor FlgM [Sphingomonas abietis]WBO22128.1 flagellar biosynthesis anti-sigma factor FlgM [Sphingomonas abietis]
MINSIGSPGTSLTGIGSSATQRGEAATKINKPASSLEDRGAVSTTVSQLASQGAPIDSDRVSALKAAIKAGTYKADPHAIAQAMISADMGAKL